MFDLRKIRDISRRIKTSVEISTSLFTQVQRLSKAESTTMRQLIEEGLRKVIADRKSRGAAFVLPDASVGGKGLSPEFQTAGWDAIRDAAYGYDRG
jgi:hypothetical protein